MNKIKSIEVINLKIPFKTSFKHNAAIRSITQSVIVKVSDGKFTGFGEGCPREYVTNENIESAIDFFNHIKSKVLELDSDVLSILKFKSQHQNIIKANPAAWCAIELALIDLFAKQNHCTIENLLNISELNGIFSYTAVIGDDSVEQFIKNAQAYHNLGFKDYKVKISGDIAKDISKLNYLRFQNPNCRVRIDANNLWNNFSEAAFYIQALPYNLLAIEEPFKERSIARVIDLVNKLHVSVLLDESFTSIEQFSELYQNKQHIILNLRVSKLGGLLNTLQIAQKANELGIQIIFGAQVGETSILTRAGLCAAHASTGNCIAMEGAFGTMLLEYDIVKNPIMFKQGGIVNISENSFSKQPGLGLNIEL